MPSRQVSTTSSHKSSIRTVTAIPRRPRPRRAAITPEKAARALEDKVTTRLVYNLKNQDDFSEYQYLQPFIVQEPPIKASTHRSRLAESTISLPVTTANTVARLEQTGALCVSGPSLRASGGLRTTVSRLRSPRGTPPAVDTVHQGSLPLPLPPSPSLRTTEPSRNNRVYTDLPPLESTPALPKIRPLSKSGDAFNATNLAKVLPALISWRLLTFYASFVDSSACSSAGRAAVQDPLVALRDLLPLLSSIKWVEINARLQKQQAKYARRSRLAGHCTRSKSSKTLLLLPEPLLTMCLEERCVVKKAASLTAFSESQILRAIDAFARTQAPLTGRQCRSVQNPAAGAASTASSVRLDANHLASHQDFELLATTVLEDMDLLVASSAERLFWSCLPVTPSAAATATAATTPASSPKSSASSQRLAIQSDVTTALRRCRDRYFASLCWDDRKYWYGWCGWRCRRGRRLVWALSREAAEGMGSVWALDT